MVTGLNSGLIHSRLTLSARHRITPVKIYEKLASSP